MPATDLKLKRGEQKTIAEKLGLAPSVVNGVLHGTYPIPRTSKSARTVRRVQVAIAQAVGRRVDEVFPKETAAA
jgi:DNA-binding transcriptional regulator YdaS (Cro superfamily)